MPFVATLTIPYHHVIKVAVAAKTAEQAGETALRALWHGELWRAGGPCAVVSDQYTEDEASGEVATPVVAHVRRAPAPDASVRDLEGRALAVRCVDALLAAHAGGTVDRPGVAAAYALAERVRQLLPR